MAPEHLPSPMLVEKKRNRKTIHNGDKLTGVKTSCLECGGYLKNEGSPSCGVGGNGMS